MALISQRFRFWRHYGILFSCKSLCFQISADVWKISNIVLRDITLKMSIVIEIKNIVGFLARAFQLEKRLIIYVPHDGPALIWWCICGKIVTVYLSKANFVIWNYIHKMTFQKHWEAKGLSFSLFLAEYNSSQGVVSTYYCLNIC